jgi:hypothetical protein
MHYQQSVKVEQRHFWTCKGFKRKQTKRINKAKKKKKPPKTHKKPRQGV